MENFLKDKIKSYFKEQSTFSKDQLVDCIQSDFPNLKASTITVYLSRLIKEGIIKNPSRGLYAISEKMEFSPLVDSKLKRLFNKVKKKYPYAEVCIWNTIWLNEFMRHQPFKFYTVLELEKDVAESVFHMLKEDGKEVYLEPDAETFDLYISNAEEVILLKYLVSEAPIQKIESFVVPTIEKLLVDMTIDTKLYAAQQSEIQIIYTNAFKKYEINKSKMKRYAYRRNRENEIVNLTNLTLAKNE